MSTKFDALTHGTNGLILGYTLVFAPMLIGLRQGRAPWIEFVRSPLVAMLATVVASIVIALLGRPLLHAMGVTHGSTLELLFGLGVMIAIGYATGRLVAARKGDPESHHRRGAVVTDPQPSPISPSESSNPNTPVTLAAYPVPLQDETKRFKLIGTDSDPADTDSAAGPVSARPPAPGAPASLFPTPGTVFTTPDLFESLPPLARPASPISNPPQDRVKLPSKARHAAKSSQPARKRPRKPRTGAQSPTTSLQPASSPAEPRQPPS